MDIKFKLVNKETGKLVGYEYLTDTGWRFDLTLTKNIGGVYPDYIHTNVPDVERFQFINSHDRNGNEVYAGDLLKAPSGKVFTVSWFTEEMRWSMVTPSGRHWNMNMGLLEIITEEHLKTYDSPA